MAVFPSSVEKQAREAEIIGAYHELLREKLSACGTPVRDRNVHRCGSPACPTCRRLHGRAEGRRAIRFFDCAARHDMALLTVAVGLIELNEIDATNRKFISDCRNLVNAERRDWPRRWAGVRLMGWPEVDVISEGDLPLMPGRLATYVAQSRPTWRDGVVFNAHWHLIVDCAGLDLQEVRDAFADQWKAEGAVDIRPFHMNKSIEDNVKAIAGYSHEFKTSKTWEGITNWWPIRSTANMYATLAATGWTGKRFTLNPRKQRSERLSSSSNDVPFRRNEEEMAWLV